MVTDTRGDDTVPEFHQGTGAVCEVTTADFPYCLGTSCYVRIHLQLGEELPGVPCLYPYDMTMTGLNPDGTPNPTYHPWNECPCSTRPDLSDKCNPAPS